MSDMGACRHCGGTGWVQKTAVDFSSRKPKKIRTPCRDCAGTGRAREPKQMNM